MDLTKPISKTRSPINPFNLLDKGVNLRLRVKKNAGGFFNY